MKRLGRFLPSGAALLALGWAPVCFAEPVVTALVLDTSGSVGTVGLLKTRDLALKILGGLPAGSEVAIFSFDDQSRLLQPRTQQPEAVRRALSTAAVAGHHTALHDALYDASRYLSDGRSRAAIVLVTDGRDVGSDLNLEDGLRVAQEAHIPVFTVGVGKVEERILRRIAKLTGGAYVGVDQARGAAIASDISAATARMAVAAGPSPAAVTAPAGGAPKAAGAPPAPTVGGAPNPKSPPSRASQVAPSGRAGSFWIWAGLVVAAGAGAAFLVLQRRGRRQRCVTCGRELANAFASCAFCDAASPREPVGDRTLKADLSPTLLARLNDTAEYLEKTVTLRERPVLSVTRGPGTGQLFEVNEGLATSIGRARANDIVLQDVSVSSQHCRIRPENGGFTLHDLQSTNGTFVNEKRVTQCALTDGDVLQIGETFLQFHKEHRRV